MHTGIQYHVPSLSTELPMYEASVVSVSEQLSEPGICLSCAFFSDSTADGCAVRLQNDEHTFVFNTSRQNDEDLVLLECFPVEEEGTFTVTVFEIQSETVHENIRQQLHDIIEITEEMTESKTLMTILFVL